MKEVSEGQGRTVLFVSHNMTAVKNICKKGMLLVNGKVNLIGDTEEVVNKYLALNKLDSPMKQEFDSFEEAPGNDLVRMKRMEVCPHKNNNDEGIITVNDPLDIEFEFWNKDVERPINLSMHVYNGTGDCVFNLITVSRKLECGLYGSVCKIPAPFLNDGIYSISMMIVAESSYAIYNFENIISFEVNEKRRSSGWHGKRPGYVRPSFEFSLNKIHDTRNENFPTSPGRIQ